MLGYISILGRRYYKGYVHQQLKETTTIPESYYQCGMGCSYPFYFVDVIGYEGLVRCCFGGVMCANAIFEGTFCSYIKQRRGNELHSIVEINFAYRSSRTFIISVRGLNLQHCFVWKVHYSFMIFCWDSFAAFMPH
jgi:hypothetical protein